MSYLEHSYDENDEALDLINLWLKAEFGTVIIKLTTFIKRHSISCRYLDLYSVLDEYCIHDVLMSLQK